MIDEGTLRERLPEIPWDQPVEIVLTREQNHDVVWLCRYCVTLDPVGVVAVGFGTRQRALDHIERKHHD